MIIDETSFHVTFKVYLNKPTEVFRHGKQIGSIKNLDNHGAQELAVADGVSSKLIKQIIRYQNLYKDSRVVKVSKYPVAE